MNILDFLTDRVALVATVLIGMATTSYLFATVTPELWSQIVMGIFGAGLPLLAVRFLVKKQKGLFILCMMTIVYADVSLILSLTEGQSRAYVAESSNETPKELARLQEATNAAQATLDALTAQYGQAQRRDTLAELDRQIAAARDDLRAAQATERAWKPTEAHGSRVNSHDVFMAIPRAVTSLDLSRYLTLAFALVISIVYQGTIIATTKATVKHVRAEGGKRKRRRRRTTIEKAPQESGSVVQLAEEERT